MHKDAKANCDFSVLETVIVGCDWGVPENVVDQASPDADGGLEAF